MTEFKCKNTASPDIKESFDINPSDNCIESFDNTSIKGIAVTKKELSKLQENMNNAILVFKDSVINDNQFCLANYIDELSQQNEWSEFLKNAPYTLTEFELTELVSAIFLSDVNVFTEKIKNLLIACATKYPDSELFDIANGYLELYESEYENLK